MKKTIISLLFIYLVFSYTSMLSAHTEGNHIKENHSEHHHEHHHHGDYDDEHDEHDEHHDHKHEHAHEHNHDHEHEHEHEHSHDEHGHDHHDEGIKLTQDQIKASNIVVSEATKGSLSKNITLNGEIKINTNNQTHHVARASGICQKIFFNIGDKVKEGQILAVLDSAVMGQAKSEYYERFNQTAISEMNLERARTMNQNVNKLLKSLAKMPENTDNLLNDNNSDMGEYRAKLIAAYSEFIISKKSFDRKSKLFKDKIISENDFLNAKSAYDKARAEYFSVRDTTAYEVKQNLFEIEQSHKTDEFRMYSAEQNLRILGLDTKDIAKLNLSGAVYQKECVDNSCIYNENNSKHSHTNGEMFSYVEIKAKRSGTVITRNIELGEEAESNKTIFTIADLDSVYADLQASNKDLSSLKEGQQVTIISDEEDKTIGKILTVSPIISEDTRTAMVRVLIDNHDNRFRPGSFVTGKINISADNLPIVLPKEAVQNIKGSNVVFVESTEGFKPVDVVVGREDSGNIEIISGLKTGTKYVSKGAFTLKSIVVTSGIDPHAGHGH